MNEYILEKNEKGIFQDYQNDNKIINKEVKNNIITYFNTTTLVKAKENGYKITPKVITAKSIITEKDIPLYMKYFNLKKYMMNTSIGSYSFKNDEIKMHLNNILRSIDLNNNINIEEMKFIKFIYHELAHQIQLKTRLNEIIEYNLITINEVSKKPLPLNTYALYHDYFEIEIDANIRAFTQILMEIENGILPRHKENIDIIYKNLEFQENLRKTEEYKKINLR